MHIITYKILFSFTKFSLLIPIFVFPVISFADNPTCDDAKALVYAQKYQDAFKLYRKLINISSTKKCARTELILAREKAAKYYVTRGDVYKEAGESKKSIEQYVLALNIKVDQNSQNDPEINIVKYQATAKNSINTILLSPIRLYVEKGMYSEAKTALNSLITSNKISSDMLKEKNDFTYLLEGKALFFKKIQFISNEWGVVSLIAVAGLLISYFLLYLVRTVQKPILYIESFDATGVETEITGMSAFSAMVRTRLFHLSHALQSGNRIEQITAPIAKFKIPAEMENALPSKLAWVKLIPWLFTLIFKRNIVQLTGYLHKPGKRGAGVTLQLTKNKRIIGSETLWQKDYLGGQSIETQAQHQVAAYYRLSEYATIWLLYNMPKSIFSVKKQLQKTLGTLDWFSYAAFRAAYHVSTDGNSHAAKKLYLVALDNDPNFHAAKVNLAVQVENDYNGSNKYSLSPKIELVEQVVDDLNSIKVRKSLNPTLYIAWKNLIVWTYEKAGSENLSEANRQVDALLSKIEICLSEIRRNNKLKKFMLMNSEIETDIESYFQRIAPQIEAISAGMKIEKGDPDTEEGKKLLNNGIKLLNELNRNKEYRFIYGVQYNLACTNTILAGIYSEDSAECKKSLLNAIENLERAYWLDDENSKAKDADKSLTLLKQHFLTKERFQKLFKKSDKINQVAASSQLADILLIGAEHANQLAEIGIDNFNELLDQTPTKENLKTLSKKLSIKESYVKIWVKLAELSQLRTMDSQRLNLLNIAGILSVEDLQTANSKKLFVTGQKISNELDMKPFPSLERLIEIIFEAKVVEPKI